MMNQPLAERMRPSTLDDYIGQKHLVGKDAVLRKMIEAGRVPSFILWGPPGVGKTTLAHIIANKLSVEVGGNYDVGQRGAYTTTNNPLSVDGYVTWVLNKSGSLKLKGFTRTIDRFDESQGLQDNGVGIYYRQEFQSWKDLQQRYRAWREAVRLRRAVRQEKRFEKRQLKKAGRFEPEDTSGSVPEEAKDTVAVDAVLPSDTTRVGAPVSGDGARRVK